MITTASGLKYADLKVGHGPAAEPGKRGMKPGGKRRLVIPPNLAYGSHGSGDGLIPPNSTLTYDVEVLMVQSRK